MLNVLNIVYVLIAIAMTAFILLQRGAGATAGASFGAGASATVFGSRGASSFLTRATAILATTFFVLTLGMGMYVSRGAGIAQDVDLGVMGQSTSSETPVKPKPASDVPQAPKASPGPASPNTATPVSTTPGTQGLTVEPLVPMAAVPAPSATATDVPAVPAAQTDDKPAR